MDFISALWSDPLTLRRLGVVLQRVAIAFVLFGGLTQFMKHIVDERINTLNTDLSTKKDLDNLQTVQRLQSEIASAQQKQTEAERSLDALQNYAVVASLNPYGLKGIAGAGLKEEPSPLSKALEGTWIKSDDKITISCDDSSLEKFRRVMTSDPQFPFTYYGLAVCLRDRGESSWRGYAEKAVEILKITTSLEAHHPIHDKVLAHLREILSESR
jgi:hypothetical protein